MISYIDNHKEEYGVEPICKQLPIAPSTYYAAKARPESKRSVTDAVTTEKISRVHRENYSVYEATTLRGHYGLPMPESIH